MSVSLTIPLPLRTTAQWEGYKTIQTVPINFGRIISSPLQYSADRRRWVISGAAITAVHEVTIGDTAYSAYDVVAEVDSAGQPLTVLELRDSVEESDLVYVEHSGLPHPTRGHLLTNPGEWLWYVLNYVAGIEIDEARLLPFIRECYAANLELNGQLTDNSSSARSAIAAVLASVDALFSLGAPRVAALWPPVDGFQFDPLRPIVERDLLPGATAQATDAALINELTVRYGPDWSARAQAQSLVSANTASIIRSGRRPQNVDARWTATAQQAAAVAERRLKWYSRPVHGISAAVATDRDIGIWESVSLPEGLPLPAGCDEFVVLTSDIDYSKKRIALRGEKPSGPVPNIEVVSQGIRFTDLSIAIVVDTIDGVTTITAKDGTGKPLPGAVITIAAQSKVANEAGQAVFEIDPGEYTLEVEANGFTKQTIDNYRIR